MNNEQSKAAGLSRNWLWALFLLALTFVAYQPVWHIENLMGEGIDPDLHSWQGLRHIWTEQGEQTPMTQHLAEGKAYYPLAYTTYWLEYHLWGPKPLGYYLDNVLLHGLNAVVLWMILRRLSVPGAWLGAALWALHPVNVESVAWIVERKNTLSGLFYLCAIMASLKYWLPEVGEERRPAGDAQSLATSASADAQHGPVRFYWVTLLLYVLGLFSKTTVIPLPVVILLLVWWKRDRILWQDVRPLLPCVVIGIAMGLDTMHVEHNLSTTADLRVESAVPLLGRFLIAGRDVWFYLGKLLWPHPLIFNYARWKVDPASALAWLQLLALAVLLALLWLKRHSWGRSALFAFLYFLALLAPVLGFLSAIFFRRSFVADHYQYLACMGPLALAAAGIAAFFGRWGKAGRILQPLLSAGLLSVLGILTWNQCRMYANPETLWRAALAVNPDAWLLHDDLAVLLSQKGQLDEGIEQYRMALQINPNARISCQLAGALLNRGKPDEAMVYFEKALQIEPDYALAYEGLGCACLAAGHTDEAIQNFQKALQIQPELPMSCYNLGNAYIQKGQWDLAIQAWQQAVTIEPDFAAAHNNLGNALAFRGQIAGAIQHWKSALATEPDLGSAQVNLAWVLATCPQASLRDGAGAVQLAERADKLSGGNNPIVLRTLAAAYAEDGRFSDAVATAQHAAQSAILQGNKQLAALIQEEMKFYQNNQPFRDSTMMK